jgi:hypothetical protein
MSARLPRRHPPGPPLLPPRRAAAAPCADQGTRLPLLPVPTKALGCRRSLCGQASHSVRLTTTPCVAEATMARSSSTTEVNSLANGSLDGYQ